MVRNIFKNQWIADNLLNNFLSISVCMMRLSIREFSSVGLQTARSERPESSDREGV